MRGNKDDKRVLRAGNGRNNNKRRNRLPTQLRNNSRNNRRQDYGRNQKKEKKPRNGKTVLLMILVLVAFIVGAGMGVLMSFDDGTVEQNETQVENVTVEMTTHLNETDQVVFDEEDSVDFNENQSSEILGAEDNPYYTYTEESYY